MLDSAVVSEEVGSLVEFLRCEVRAWTAFVFVEGRLFVLDEVVANSILAFVGKEAWSP